MHDNNKHTLCLLLFGTISSATQNVDELITRIKDSRSKAELNLTTWKLTKWQWRRIGAAMRGNKSTRWEKQGRHFGSYTNTSLMLAICMHERARALTALSPPLLHPPRYLALIGDESQFHRLPVQICRHIGTMLTGNQHLLELV